MNAQSAFGDEDFFLFEFNDECTLELSDKTATAATLEIKHGYYNNVILIDLFLTLPDSSHWKLASLGSQASKPGTSHKELPWLAPGSAAESAA